MADNRSKNKKHELSKNRETESKPHQIAYTTL